MDDLSIQTTGPAGQENPPAGIRRRLGKGLNALLGGTAIVEEPLPEEQAAPPAGVNPSPPSPLPEGGEVRAAGNHAPDPTDIHVDLIEPNPFQPRKEFASDALEELASSIRQHGVLQPLLVRITGSHYQLIAGERRWLAAKQAGLETIPCRVLELADPDVFEVALEENLKRKDLNVLEKAQAFQDYLTRFDGSIEELARRLSMNRSTLSNYLRLLELSEPVKQALREDKITNGHARALLPLEEPDQIALCRRIDAEGLSVRKTEQAVRALLRPNEPKEDQVEPAETIPFPEADSARPSEEMSNHLRSLQEQLRNLFGTKVEIRLKSREAGRLIIPFDSIDDFEQIVRLCRRAAA